MIFAFSLFMRFVRLIFFFVSALFQTSGKAQIWYNNMPSGEQTEKKEWTVTYRGHYFDKISQENIHFTYGKKRGTELGVNLLNMRRNSSGKLFFGEKDNQNGKVGPLITGHIQKRIKILKTSLVFGLQAGGAFSSQNFLPAYYHYGLFRKEWRRKPWELSVGYYKANRNYLGSDGTFGGMLGFGYKLADKEDYKLHVVTDYTSGNNFQGGISAGLRMSFMKYVRANAAYYFPSRGFSGVLLTVNVSSYERK